MTRIASVVQVPVQANVIQTSAMRATPSPASHRAALVTYFVAILFQFISYFDHFRAA